MKHVFVSRVRKTKIEKKIKSKRHSCLKRENHGSRKRENLAKRKGKKEESNAAKYDIQSIQRDST